MFYDVFGAKVERETFAKQLTSHAANSIFVFVCVSYVCEWCVCRSQLLLND